jgi:DNA (cytosine-5)-methyltransferase 1
MPYDLTEEQRNRYRETSIRSQLRKRQLLGSPSAEDHHHPIDPARRLDADDLMPQLRANGLTCLSLFSGGGGLDLGFERAGFGHSGAFEVLDVCGSTLRDNRPQWDIRAGTVQGDVRAASFTGFRGVHIVHGGPPWTM